jgi:hypothetical protein
MCAVRVQRMQEAIHVKMEFAFVSFELRQLGSCDTRWEIM